MSIQEGDKIPAATLYVMENGAPVGKSTEDLFGGKKVVLFAVPGAFTPTCSQAHLPGFVVHADDILGKGADSIICMSVNDAFVMGAWGEHANAEKLIMAGDGNGEFTAALGLELDGTGFGLGKRSQRFAMIVDDGTVTKLAVEAPGALEVSTAEAMLAAL